MNRVAVTRRMLSELDASFDSLRSKALLLAELADDRDSRPADRIKAVVEWQATLDQVSSRIVEAARRESSWQEHRPRAV
jgi:hypothetical protein